VSAARAEGPVRAGAGAAATIPVTRVQTGIRIERRLLKVMKGIAELHDMTLGDLLEGICLHAIEGKAPFGPATIEAAAALKRLYGLDLDATASHRMREPAAPRRARAATSRRRSAP